MLSSFWTALALLKAKHLYLLVLPSHVNECLNCIIRQFLEMAHKHWCFVKDFFQDWSAINHITVPIAEQNIVGFCMRLSVCMYGISSERQACAYQI